MNFRLKLWHHHSIPWPWYPYRHDISVIWGRFLLIFAFDKLNVRHISTSGLVDLLTYKVCYVIRTSRWKFPASLKLIRPSIIPLPSYNVIAADTLRDLMTLTFDLLTLLSGNTWRVMWSTTQPSLKILRLSVLELWVLTSPIRYHWQRICSHCACAASRDLCAGGKLFPHIWNHWPWFAYSLCKFYGATIKTNGVIRQNNVWPCAKDNTSLCACAKSRQHWTLP